MKKTRRQFVGIAGSVGTLMLAGCMNTEKSQGSQKNDETQSGSTSTAEFTIRIENVSTNQTLQTSQGAKPIPLSPVAYAVHEEESVFFMEDKQASAGLERLAEDGSPNELIERLKMEDYKAGAVTVPEGSEDPAPIGPGGAYEFTVSAQDGQRLSLATMFVQSNDLFYAPEQRGIPLFENGKPIDGDLTNKIILWDAGTEVNEEPGIGSSQAPRQSGSNTGMDEEATIRRVSNVNDNFEYPATSEVISVTITPE